MAVAVFSKEDVEREVQTAIKNYAEGELIRQVKGIVNGMKNQLEELGKDFQAFKQRYDQAYLMRATSAAELADQLHLVRLDTQEDVEVIKEIVEEKKRQGRRSRWWHGWLGLVLTIVGILYTFTSMMLILYNTFRGVHR